MHLQIAIMLAAAQLEAADRSAEGRDTGNGDDRHPGADSRPYRYTDQAMDLFLAAGCTIERTAPHLGTMIDSGSTTTLEVRPGYHRRFTEAEQRELAERVRQEEAGEEEP